MVCVPWLCKARASDSIIVTNSRSRNTTLYLSSCLSYPSSHPSSVTSVQLYITFACLHWQVPLPDDTTSYACVQSKGISCFISDSYNPLTIKWYAIFSPAVSSSTLTTLHVKVTILWRYCTFIHASCTYCRYNYRLCSIWSASGLSPKHESAKVYNVIFYLIFIVLCFYNTTRLLYYIITAYRQTNKQIVLC